MKNSITCNKKIYIYIWRKGRKHIECNGWKCSFRYSIKIYSFIEKIISKNSSNECFFTTYFLLLTLAALANLDKKGKKNKTLKYIRQWATRLSSSCHQIKCFKKASRKNDFSTFIIHYNIKKRYVKKVKVRFLDGK